MIDMVPKSITYTLVQQSKDHLQRVLLEQVRRSPFHSLSSFPISSSGLAADWLSVLPAVIFSRVDSSTSPRR